MRAQLLKFLGKLIIWSSKHFYMPLSTFDNKIHGTCWMGHADRNRKIGHTGDDCIQMRHHTIVTDDIHTPVTEWKEHWRYIRQLRSNLIRNLPLLSPKFMSNNHAGENPVITWPLFNQRSPPNTHPNYLPNWSRPQKSKTEDEKNPSYPLLHTLFTGIALWVNITTQVAR